MHKLYYLAFSTSGLDYMLYSAPPGLLFLVHAAVHNYYMKPKVKVAIMGAREFI